MEYVESERGFDLLRLATEDEVRPMDIVYLKDPLNASYFRETEFYPEVSWDSILEFITVKRLYVRNQTTDIPSLSESPKRRGSGVGQSSLF